MKQESSKLAAIVLPTGPGKDATLDTLASIEYYCPEPHIVVVIDDCTQDGTYEAISANRRDHWHVLRNKRPMGVARLVHSLCTAYRFVLEQTKCNLILRLDQDALLIRSGVLTDAFGYAGANSSVGLFGVYEHDYNRDRAFQMHTTLMTREVGWPRNLLGLMPSWAPLLVKAEMLGYRRGDNVFGGAYFLTRDCLVGMRQIGALDVPYRWHSRLMEDVYFSMAAVAAGYKLGHFAAPEGPLCLEWRGLPYPAEKMLAAGYKVVHSVDKGKNTDRGANDGRTAREVFRSLRTLGRHGSQIN